MEDSHGLENPQQEVFCCEVSQLQPGKLGITRTAKYLDTGQFEKIFSAEI